MGYSNDGISPIYSFVLQSVGWENADVGKRTFPGTADRIEGGSVWSKTIKGEEIVHS